MSGSAADGADFLGLQPASAPPRGITTWLAAALRDAVLDGRLGPGARLPATRTLAADLGVARGVVVEAYQRLVDEGLLAAHAGRGTVVRVLDELTETPRRELLPPSDHHGVPRLPRVPASPEGGGVLDLSPGVPDLSAFPRAAWLRAERVVLQQLSTSDLGYGDPRGSRALREALSGWLAATRGVRAGADEIIVVAGVAQALALMCQTLRRAGELEIAVEEPGSRGTRQEVAHWGLDPVPVRVDGDGLDVEALRRTDALTALVTPAHQFPTGVVLSPDRRHALLGWARDGRLVIEDDYDAEHRYDRPPVRALQAMAPDHVAHAGSTSKSLAPGLRLGWLVPPHRLHADLVEARHATDLGSPALPQLVLAHLLRSGEYDRHLRAVRKRQRRRRDAVLAALAAHLPEARVEGVAAGLHLLVTLPGNERYDDDREIAASIRARDVVVHPLSWHRQRPGPPGIVLGYAAHTPDQLTEAVARIAAALRR